jgi:hypothetical protein
MIPIQPPQHLKKIAYPRQPIQQWNIFQQYFPRKLNENILIYKKNFCLI